MKERLIYGCDKCCSSMVEERTRNLSHEKQEKQQICIAQLRREPTTVLKYGEAADGAGTCCDGYDTLPEACLHFIPQQRFTSYMWYKTTQILVASMCFLCLILYMLLDKVHDQLSGFRPFGVR